MPDPVKDLAPQTTAGWWWQRWLARLGHRDARTAAAALILALALLHIIAGEQVWNRPRDFVFDAYQRWFPRAVKRFPVAIIDIDEHSIQAIGRWPWPRTRLAQLVEATRRLGAMAVGLDMILPEADRLSPRNLLHGRTDVDPSLHEALSRLRSNDEVFADALRGTPSVIARAAVAALSGNQSAPARYTPVLVDGELSLAALRSFSAEIANIAEIEEAASGAGYANDTRDADGVVRTMPVVMTVGGTVVPSLALEILRVAAGEKHYRVLGGRNGARGVQVGDSFIPVERDGRIRLHFSPSYARRRISAAAVLDGSLKPGALANQVAIVGLTAIGISDVAPTPIHARMDGVEIHAQLMENMLSGGRLLRPVASPWWELLALLAMTLPMIAVAPRLRLVAGIFLGGTILIFAGSVLLFKQGHQLVDPSFSAAGGGLVYLLLLISGLAVSERRRQELDLALAGERIERLRVAGELRAARDIQMGMVPDPRRIEGLPANIDFFAMLEPAQEVGGDLYDAFMLDDDRLCFIIGDVSGKGVPASLFMALTKTLAKSLARREQMPLDQVMRRINEEVSRENSASMFVTTIIGTIDARSGMAELCNAGHNAPIRVRSSGAAQELEGADGPPLCIDETFPYTAQRLKLERGDMLILFTDGITEAEDERQYRYGTARALECLARLPVDAAAACAQVYADVKRFIGDAPQSDDLAILAIRMNGKE